MATVTKRASATASLTYLVRSMLAIPEGRRTTLVGPRAKPWCELLEQLSQDPQPEVRSAVLPLLWTILKRVAELTPVQRALAGTAARRLLTRAWDGGREPGIIRLGIQGLCRTYDAAPVESAALLRRAIEPSHLSSHGFEELPILAQEVEPLINLAPGLLEEVFRAAFSFREADTSPTPVLESNTLALRSNRRQDYETALSTLAEVFPRFIAVAPVEATGAVIAAVEAHAAQRALRPLDTIPAEAFWFDELEARYVADHSYVWDGSSSYADEPQVVLLRAFEERLVSLAHGGDTDLLARVLARVARENRFAAVWRRVLAAAIRAPRALGVRVWRLAGAVPVLAGDDTVEQAGHLLGALFPLLDSEQREAVERSILSLPDARAEVSGFYAARRDVLLGCLPRAFVVTPDVRSRLGELAAAGGPPPNEPLFTEGDASVEFLTSTDRLVSQGVDLRADPNSRLNAVCEPVREFAERFQTQSPTREEAVAALPGIAALRDQLSQHNAGADPRLVDSAWTSLAGACGAVTEAEWLPSEPAATELVRSVLLASAKQTLSRPDTSGDREFEEHGLLAPTPRWYAAQGLANLTRCSRAADAEVTDALRLLANDSSTQVRSEVARRLSALLPHADTLFWEVIRRVEASETSRIIVLFALRGLGRPLRQYAPQMLLFAQTVFKRFRNTPGASKIRNECLRIVIAIRSTEGCPFGDELVTSVLDDLTEFQEEGRYLIQTAAEGLTSGPVDPPEHRADGSRLACFSFLEQVARLLLGHIRDVAVRTQGVAAADWPSDLRTQIETIRRLSREVALRTYFASGAFEAKTNKPHPRRGSITGAVKARFLREASAILELLAEFGLPDVAQHVLETLAAYTSFEPRRVFLIIGRAVRHAEAGGFQSDDLAANLVVRLVRSYLADYRGLFREDPECRAALLELLNTFVRAGWAEVLELTFRLEEIFR